MKYLNRFFLLIVCGIACNINAMESEQPKVTPCPKVNNLPQFFVCTTCKLLTTEKCNRCSKTPLKEMLKQQKILRKDNKEKKEATPVQN